MSAICGGQEPLLNLTALWEADNPNLPRCFSRTVLTILPAIVLAVNWVQALAQLRPTLGRGRSSSSTTTCLVAVRLRSMMARTISPSKIGS